jgi:hypothetical protein
MDKISNVQIGQMMKVAAHSIRLLSEENQQLREKVAQFEHRARVEKVASLMEEKGLQPELSFEEKVAALSQKDNLDVIEEAVGLSAPQLKLASVHEGGRVTVEGGSDMESSAAQDNFAAALAGLD